MNSWMKPGGIIMLLIMIISLGAGSTLAAQVQEEPGQALVWQVGGEPNAPRGLGALLWQTGESDPITLADVPDEGAGTRLFACGPGATAPDGSNLIAYIGANQGGLYRVPLAGDGELTRLADAHVLACNGAGRAAYSPDGTRWAYIAFDANSVVADPSQFAVGVLRVLDPVSGETAAEFEDAVAFDLRNDGLFMLQFYTDAQGKADEAAVSFWNGTSRPRDWGDSLVPADGCSWTGAAMDSNADGSEVIVSLGEHCTGGSQWRVFTLKADGSVGEHVYMPSGGGFFPVSTVNQVYYLSDGLHALAIYPNGRANNIGNLVLIGLAQNTVTLITAGVTVDTFPAGTARYIRFSPDGRFLAYVSSDANDNNALHRLTLDGGITPLTISAGPQHDAISSFFFRPDGGLVYVAGGVDGGDNALYLLPPDAAEPGDARRLLRGSFLRNWGLATADHALVLEYVEAQDTLPATANLLLVPFDGDERVLVEGRAVDNAVAYPLAWR